MMTQTYQIIDLFHCYLLYLKNFEKVLLEQITTYLDNNNLIHNHQYGFRKRHSTQYAALHIVHYLTYEMA